MEFSLEGILETLLIGALASLCLLSSLFLVVPSFVRLDFIHRIFKFFLYEDGVGKSQEVAEAHASGTSVPQLHFSEPNRLFAGILLCASLYGSGLIAESLSDVITSSEFSETKLARQLRFFSDPEIRIGAFDSVGESALRAGSLPTDLAEFMTDYRACRENRLLEDKKFCPSCSTIYSRARSFYYTAKNVVYREESYFKELSRLQNRIDFTRAASQILAFLALELALAYAIGGMAEGLWRYKQLRNNNLPPTIGRLYRLSPAFVRSLLKHWTHLDAIRCLGMGMLAFLLAIAALFSWRDNEDEFDRRVFGYFLSFAKDDKQTSWAAPKSTFTRFEIDADRFEPSAVAALGDSQCVLVANDKGGATPFSIFKLGRQPGNSQSGEAHDSSTLGKLVTFGLDGNPIRKIESVHMFPTPAGYTVWTAGTFEGEDPSNSRIVSFNIPRDEEALVDLTSTTKSTPIQLSLKSMFDCLGVKPFGCVVEGMTSRDPGKEILLGVRYLVLDGKRVPTVAVVRLTKKESQVPASEPEWSAERLWSFTLAGEFKDSGISALEISPHDGSLLVLTSIEDDSVPGTASQVRGALWRIPRDFIDRPSPEGWSIDRTGEKSNDGTYLAGLFPHKPEGVTVLDNDSILIVFDDDGKRKSREYAPETFALEQNESVFTVVRPLPISNR